MANTYYDSKLTAAEIEAALEAIDGVIVPANNGKVLAINNGKLEARSVQWGGGAPVIEALTVTQNGTYTAPSGVDGYSPVVVNVSGGGGSDAEVPGDPFSFYTDYLESSGTQYIDTGYVFPANQSGMRIEVLCKLLARDLNAGDGTLYGVDNIYCNITANGNNQAYYIVNWNVSGVNPYTGINSAYYNDNVKRLFTHMNDGGVFRSSILGNYNYSLSHTYRDQDSANSLFLFAKNSNGSVGPTTFCAIKLYNFKVYEKDKIAVDIVPALDANDVPCCYDNVRGIYLYNQGTGDFVFGTDT